MQIRSAQFVISATSLDGCPDPDVPEFAFIGRSNVGKSSLIKLLVPNAEIAVREISQRLDNLGIRHE